MKVILKNVRLAFPVIWTPKPFEAGGEPRFSGAALFDKDHPAFKEVMDAIVTVAKEGFKEQWETQLAAFKGNSNKMCFIDGNLKAKYEGFADNYALSAVNKSRPTIRDRDGKTPLVEADGRPYGGCYVDMIVDIWAQTKKYPGIRATLLGIQFRGDGDAFSGGGVAADDDFADLSDGKDAPMVGSGSGGGGFV